MGCTNTKISSSAVTRMMEYERLAASEDSGLKAVPGPLDIEEWRDGLISPRTLYNTFHAGYCSAYIQNPAYLLLIDFRGLEDWVVERVATAQPWSRLEGRTAGLERFSCIVLYDQDGSAAGNTRSPLARAYRQLRDAGLEPRVLLGGFRALQADPFCALLERPHTIPFAVAVQPTVANSVESLAGSLASGSEPELEEVAGPDPQRRAITWLPSMLDPDLYLGRADQASDTSVIEKLGITHILSTSRVRPNKFKGLVYILVNKTSFSHSTLKLTSQFILEALAGGGRVLIAGCDGFDQSAAVAAAALMRRYTATLEDCLWFLHTTRPGVSISPDPGQMLAQLELEMFGKQLSDLQVIWCFDQ